MRSFSIGLVVSSLIVVSALDVRAQDDDSLISPGVIRARAEAASRLLAAGDADAAHTALEGLQDELWSREQFREAASFGCTLGVARLRASGAIDDEALRSAVSELGSGLASAPDVGHRRDCLESGALALAHAAERTASASPAPPAPVLDELRFRAATWLRRARAGRERPELRAAYDALPTALRTLVDAVDVPAIEAPDPEELARRLAQARYLADPSRLAECALDLEAPLSGAGVIDCYDWLLPSDGFGAEYPHVAYYFVASGASVRVIGRTTRLSGFDCESGVVRQTVRFVRLRAARDGIDGTMRVVREGGDVDDWTDLTTVVDVCDAAQRTCRSTTIARTRCDVDERDRQRCSERWGATAHATRDALVLRRASGTLPVGLATSIPWTALFASSDTAIGNARRSDRGARCRAEIADPRPPLNVRAEPDAQSAVVATLANGTSVRTLERRAGWVRIDLPIAGWVWSRNLRQVCD